MQRSMMRLMGWVVALWLVGATGAAVLAQPGGSAPAPAASSASQASQDQFVPVKSLPQQEQLPAASLLMTAYGFVWAVLLVYLWTIWRRVIKVERELHDLSARIAEKSARH
jgi:CcmD family protein